MKVIQLIQKGIGFFLVFMTLISCKKDDQVVDIPSDTWPTDSIRVVKDSLNFPWEILWGKDNFIWVTERQGKISKIDPLTGRVTFTATIGDVVSQGEGGLLGMVQHPQFIANGHIFIVYNYRKNNVYTEKLVRVTYSNNSFINATTLLDDIPAANIHNGARLLVTIDGKLLLTTGDANVPNNAQSSSSLAGKVLRLNEDGSIPADNPSPSSYVFSSGHRNPQGLTIAFGKIYSSEHGPNIEDEVNIIEASRNYGWPNVNGPCDGSELTFCNANNVKGPLWSTGGNTLAYCGMEYYASDKIPSFTNSLLLTTLKDASLQCLKLGTDGSNVSTRTIHFKNTFGRLRDICVSPTGRIYLCTSNGNNSDRIIEIQRL